MIKPWFFLLSLCVLAGAASAVSEKELDSDAMVNAKEYADAQAPRADVVLCLEATRRAEAENRMEKIRNLPPEYVRDWSIGKLTEGDLERIASAPHATESRGAVTLPRNRQARLLLVGVAVLVLAFLYGRQRRSEPAVIPDRQPCSVSGFQNRSSAHLRPYGRQRRRERGGLPPPLPFGKVQERLMPRRGLPSG
ncbi:MAG: hypothetical protein WCK89_23155 [bacterium]